MLDDDLPEVPKVIIVTPHYGGVSMGLLQTINLANRDRSLLQVVMQAQSCTSVLPQCFNNLLAIALDARDQGNVTHMAMCHADILAERGWLDTLWSEMWFRKLDLISSVIPIKGPTGRTSTAIGDASDRWKVKRCIFNRDRDRLPATFDARDVCSDGEVLLVNTGLFLCDLRRPYWDDFAFAFHTRITKNADGIRETSHRSEDWEMSHHLAEAGAPYAATWRVKLHHEGNCRYANFDEEPAA